MEYMGNYLSGGLYSTPGLLYTNNIFETFGDIISEGLEYLLTNDDDDGCPRPPRDPDRKPRDPHRKPRDPHRKPKDPHKKPPHKKPPGTRQKASKAPKINPGG